MHGCEEACLWPCMCFQTNINQVQTRSQVGTLVLHCVSPCLSCQNRQTALAHSSPTWCFLIRHKRRQRKDSERLGQHRHSALLKILSKAYTAPNCLSKCISMWCLSAPPGSYLSFSWWWSYFVGINLISFPRPAIGSYRWAVDTIQHYTHTECSSFGVTQGSHVSKRFFSRLLLYQ